MDIPQVDCWNRFNSARKGYRPGLAPTEHNDVWKGRPRISQPQVGDKAKMKIQVPVSDWDGSENGRAENTMEPKPHFHL